MDLTRTRSSLAALVAALLARAAAAQEQFITVASTTSTEQSGLFKHLLPIFEKKTGIEVRVVALGTGQALDMAGAATPTSCSCTPGRRGEVRRRGLRRASATTVMYNDFVLIGPKSDPAKVAGGKDIVAGAEEDRRRAGAVRLARRQERHARRRAALWKAAGIDIATRQGRLVPRDRPGHGPGAQHRRRR